VSYTWIHRDKNELSTWSYVGGVMEIGYLTLKQTLKNVCKNEIQRVSLAELWQPIKLFNHIKGQTIIWLPIKTALFSTLCRLLSIGAEQAH